MILLFRVRALIPQGNGGDRVWEESHGFSSRELAANFANGLAKSGRCLAVKIDPYHEASPFEENAEQSAKETPQYALGTLRP